MKIKNETVYKYCHPSRADILEGGMLRFSPPTAMNDPFDSHPDLTEFITSAFISSANNLTNQFGSFKGINLPNLHLTLEQNYADFQHVYGKEFLTLCLTTKENNLLMWGHYTDSHRGFVLGFDANDDFFKEKPDYTRRFDVEYSNKRPMFPNTDTIQNSEITARKLLAVKSREWAYEEEMRIVVSRRIDKPDRVFPDPELPDTDICLYSFPPRSLTKVIFGARASNALKERVAKCISKYPRAKTYQAKSDLHDFDLHIVPLP